MVVANADLWEDVTKRFIGRMKPERLIKHGVCGLDLVSLFCRDVLKAFQAVGPSNIFPHRLPVLLRFWV